MPLTANELFSNPFTAMRRMSEEMDRVFSDLLSGRDSGDGGTSSRWMPAIEVHQRSNEMIVSAELAGMKPDDVKVQVTDEALIIEGERKLEREEKQGEQWHSERRYGQFYRSIPLPEGTNADQVRAEFKNGELCVTIPVQTPESRSRQVPIEGETHSGQTTH